MADEITPEGTDEAPAPSGRPDGLPENFNSVEALAQSYDEIRRETDRLRSQAEQDRAQFADALATMQNEQDQRAARMVDPSQDPRIIAYQRAMDEGDAATALAIQLDLTGQMVDQRLQANTSQMTPQLEAMEQAQRSQLIDMAEAHAMQYAQEKGLDYDASRNDVVEALRSLYGDQLLPAKGDITVYNRAMEQAVNIVTAEALVQDIQSGEMARREKLSAMTTTPGASGRLATGHPDEQADWDKVKDAPAGSYSELMAKQGR